MTEKQLRDKVVGIMEGFLGCKESNGSHKKILDIYNSHRPLPRGWKMLNTNPWCAATVSAAFIKAGLTDIGFVECSCSQMIALYKAKGRWMEADSYVPSPGDLMMYDWNDNGKGDCTGAPEHVGMVVSVSKRTIRILEGNNNDAVAYRNMAVNGKYIRGYCLPDYSGKAKALAEAGIKKTPVKIAAAKSFNRTYADTYTVTASMLNMRRGAGTDRGIVKKLPKGSKVTCYGYFTKNGTTIWLYVKDQAGDVGFCSMRYLKA